MELKALDWESIPVNLRLDEQKQDSFLQNNPHRFWNHGKYFTQSLAIIEYLDELHPENPLLPSGIYERAKVRGMAYQIAMEMHPLNNLRVLKELGLSEEQKNTWYQHWIAEGFGPLEKTLKNSEFLFCRISWSGGCLFNPTGL